MSRFSAAEARKRFKDVLDAAENGEVVIIERRGRRYRLELQPEAKAAGPRRSSLIVRMDPAVDKGQWSWTWSPEGVELTEGE